MIEKAKLSAIKDIASSKEELYIPVSVLRKGSLLGAVTAYLKDELGLKNSQIAKLLDKDYRSTWMAYKKYEKENT